MPAVIHNRESDEDLYDNIKESKINKAKEIPNQVLKDYNDLKIHKAIELIMQLLRSVNKYLEVKSPWKLIKSDDKKDFFKVSTTLYISAELLKIGTLLLYPVMPEKTRGLLKSLGVKSNTDFTFGTLKPNAQIAIINNLFPRIEKEK